MFTLSQLYDSTTFHNSAVLSGRVFLVYLSCCIIRVGAVRASCTCSSKMQTSHFDHDLVEPGKPAHRCLLPWHCHCRCSIWFYCNIHMHGVFEPSCCMSPLHPSPTFPLVREIGTTEACFYLKSTFTYPCSDFQLRNAVSFYSFKSCMWNIINFGVVQARAT